MGAPLNVGLGAAFPQSTTLQDTVQVTPAFAGSPVTVAVNCAVAPACSVAVVGATVTVIPIIVTVVEPVAAELVTDAAVMVTTKFPAGGAEGAV